MNEATEATIACSQNVGQLSDHEAKDVWTSLGPFRSIDSVSPH